MNPRVIAKITDFIGFAPGNSAAAPLLDAAIAASPTQIRRQQLHRATAPAAAAL
jgi:hypothetical protein